MSGHFIRKCRVCGAVHERKYAAATVSALLVVILLAVYVATVLRMGPSA